VSNYAMFSRVDSSIGPVLVVSGEVDMVTAPKFRTQVHATIGDATTCAFLDLRAVSFFDSTGISVLVHARDTAEAQGLDLVVDPSECVRAILDVVALEDRFHWGTAPGTTSTETLKSA
jgi:anti-sigma B factor antagonist